jgi:cytidyltransferase-like protein
MSTLAPHRRSRSLVLGRFQPLHLGHIEYLEAARKRADCLVIGITNPDINRLIRDVADPSRSLPQNNPFPYYDRQQMISACLLDAGWNCHDFAIVPAPVSVPLELASFLPPPLDTTVCITTYGPWGDYKAELMASLGYEVEILWRREVADRLTSGTHIREAMRSGGQWRPFVPAAVARYLDDTGWTEAMQLNRPGE